MNFYIKSFGCQYNEWDASRLSFVLKNLGLVESQKNEADIVFLLNCSVRKTGVDRVMSFTKNFTKQGKKVFVSGCILETDKRIFQERGAIIWNNENITELTSFLDLDEDKVLILKNLLREGQKNSNYIPIIKGCNNFCSYCAVPYTRGREVSRTVEEILEDIKKVIQAGYKEIWLLGQNVNSYLSPKLQIPPLTPPPRGEKNDSPLSLGGVRGGIRVGFAQLLKEINDIPGDFKVYFTSNHPKDMNDEIIEAIATLPKVAKSIHLPLQSGSNKILKAMNRPYTKEHYLALIEKIKAKIPNVELSTDTIVGFPGETEQDFQETADILKKVNFKQVFNNKYSPRSGTKAFALGDPISWTEKQRRWRILNEISYKSK